LRNEDRQRFVCEAEGTQNREKQKSKCSHDGWKLVVGKGKPAHPK
jgi:hypothetical protein